MAMGAGGFAATPGGGTRRVTLLHLTDTHAQLETHPEYLPGESPTLQMMGGFARVKTALERERSTAAEACFVVDGGDEFQGSGPAAWSEGEVMVDPLNALGLDVFVPGNWEPAYGPARFRDQMGRLEAQVACYNLHDVTSGERLFPPAVTLRRGGVTVTFVGVTDIPASTRQPPAMFAGMDTTRIEGLREFVQDVRRRERPDLVVAVTHTGLTIARQMAREM
ncbi:MAG: metallophosphoesterase, partial [Vicinamibacteria bacterium]